LPNIMPPCRYFSTPLKPRNIRIHRMVKTATKILGSARASKLWAVCKNTQVKLVANLMSPPTRVTNTYNLAHYSPSLLCNRCPLCSPLWLFRPFYWLSYRLFFVRLFDWKSHVNTSSMIYLPPFSYTALRFSSLNYIIILYLIIYQRGFTQKLACSPTSHGQALVHRAIIYTEVYWFSRFRTNR